MPRPLTPSKSSATDSEAPQKSESALPGSHHNRSSTSILPMGPVWNDALCCEARNCLQVILSGAEILLEDHVGNLLGGQRELLIKMAENTHHLCRLLSRILGPEEFKLAEVSEEHLAPRRRAPAKV
ncbi:MAG TPA: hypothetical protein VHM64_23385 [Candidatus Binatia bacterium]|nr:hypothetical protein [Candidatus Binatia bacterium]